MDLELQTKNVLVTGASRGIGLACAEGFLAEGASVTLVSRPSPTLDAEVARLSDQYPGAVRAWRPTSARQTGSRASMATCRPLTSS